MVKHTQTFLEQRRTNCLCVFGSFMRLALEGLKISRNPIVNDFCIHNDKFIRGLSLVRLVSIKWKILTRIITKAFHYFFMHY